MLLIVGEAIVAFHRTGREHYTGPWPSGSPAIAAYVAGRLGVPTVFVGAVGRDDHGTVMADGLAAGGVDISHLVVSGKAPTATAYITYRGAAREFDLRVSDSAAIQVAGPDLADLPERAGWLHLSGSALIFGEPLAGTALTALHRARAAGARISIDPNVRPESLDRTAREAVVEALGLAHVVLAGEGELAALRVDASALVADGATVCTTFGAGGATVTDESGSVHIDALPVEVVDTDGAGDAFAAGFIAAALAGADPVDAARAGVRVATEAIRTEGPMSVMPDRGLLAG
ncbi:PfkB family carbohydrate kinase [Actinoplanes sp. NPDC026619]|uniref:carbohydrate kinase family protein n=1 Tax=Actinoplanes sp. NPDC026619 TaxID=3155798 RepID=UPI0033FB5526